MVDVFKFYFNIISKLISSLWDNFIISDGINFTLFFFGSILLISFIKILKLNFDSFSDKFNSSVNNNSKGNNK